MAGNEILPTRILTMLKKVWKIVLTSLTLFLLFPKSAWANVVSRTTPSMYLTSIINLYTLPIFMAIWTVILCLMVSSIAIKTVMKLSSLSAPEKTLKRLNKIMTYLIIFSFMFPFIGLLINLLISIFGNQADHLI